MDLLENKVIDDTILIVDSASISHYWGYREKEFGQELHPRLHLDNYYLSATMTFGEEMREKNITLSSQAVWGPLKTHHMV